jgi:hypothetical protein
LGEVWGHGKIRCNLRAKYSQAMVIATSAAQGMRLRINARRTHSEPAMLRFARLR